MSSSITVERAKLEGWTDEQVVERVLAGDAALFELLMRRYNQRLYRVARAILRSDAEAEDVMQDAYVRAYQHLAQFQGRAKFSTWLTRIAVNEALARAHKFSRIEELEPLMDTGDLVMPLESAGGDPEQEACNAETRGLLEKAILTLPETYRTVLVMRDVEELNTSETAAALEITEENVKVRLHRARALLRRELYARVGANSSAAFQFMGERCDRVVSAVLKRISEL